MTDISLFDAIRTQRAIRRFTDDPVPDDAIQTILEAATRAPSGANRQPWYFLVIRDAETKRRIGEWYLDGWNVAYGNTQPGDGISSTVYQSADDLAHHMGEAPVLIMACMDRGTGGMDPSPITAGASIYPAVQNMLLAARALGLGTALTTLHRRHEDEVRQLLDIPDNVETAALIPVGYPAEGEHFGGSRRKPVSEVTYHDRWGQQAPS